METTIYNFLDKIEVKMRDRDFTQKLDFFFDIIKLLSVLLLVFLFSTQTKLMLAITTVFIFLLFILFFI